MKLIKEVRIRNFRSIRDSTRSELENFNVFSGLNNSGKSNFLRALNSFFKNESESGHPVRLDVNYFRPNIRSNKKKEIEIKITFSLPDNFNFRSELEPVKNLLGPSFNLSKKWTHDQPDPIFILNDQKCSPESSQKIRHFLALINFRYIPNRVQPMDVILKKHQSLRDALIRRLAKHKEKATEVMERLQITAGNLIGDLSKRVQEYSPDITGVRLATANSLGDLAFKFGYILQEEGVELDESEQGPAFKVS